MKIKIIKTGKGDKVSYTIYKETFWQSIITDTYSYISLAILLGLDALFTVYITNTCIIHATICLIFLMLVFSGVSLDKKEMTKEELLKEISNQ